MKQSTKIYFMALVISLLMAILKILLRNNRYTLDSADADADRLLYKGAEFNKELEEGDNL